MSHLLVDEMSYEFDDVYSHTSIVSSEATLELNDETTEQKLSDVREFRVNDGDKSCVDVRESRWECLRLDDITAEKSSEKNV